MRGNAARKFDDSHGLSVEVVERKDAPGAWTVEATDEDGSIFQAIFAGPEARERAEEYARFKYER